VIDVPKDMSKEQQDAVAAMSKAFNGADPRAGLFAGAPGAGGSADEAKGAGDGAS
jgi:hypothetical protein